MFYMVTHHQMFRVSCNQCPAYHHTFPIVGQTPPNSSGDTVICRLSTCLLLVVLSQYFRVEHINFPLAGGYVSLKSKIKIVPIYLIACFSERGYSPTQIPSFM
jgi:hypothetical protein